MKLRLASIALLATVALAGNSPKQTFTGVITDSMCANDHKAMNVTPTDKCVRECVKHSTGVRYVLFDGKKSFALSDQKTPEKFAAKRVKITGTLYEKTNIIQVDSIQPAE
jgi:hypothetical protein